MTVSSVPLPRADRPLWFPGEVLTADDLTAAQDVDAGLRHLHHRMLHGWGIAAGLAVMGVRGATSVQVGAGYALDSTGRELVLPDPVTVPLPPVAGAPDGTPLAFTLVVRWTEDADAFVVDRPGACGTEGAVRRSDVPTLAWLQPEAVLVGDDVVLAVARVQACRLAAAPELGLRRLLNPPPTPYTMCGRTAPGGTEWSVRASDDGRTWSVWTEVDTSEGGFGDTPVYIARVDGTRLLDAALSATGRPALIDGTPYVEAAEPGRFRLVVPLAPGAAFADGDGVDVNPPEVVADPALVDLVVVTLRWSVEWIGVQP